MSDLQNNLIKSSQEIDGDIKEVKSSSDIDRLWIEYFGKKGKLTEALLGINNQNVDEPTETVNMVNDVRAKMEDVIAQTQIKMKAMESAHKLKREVIDVTLPVNFTGAGSRHPLSLVINEICDIFIGLGYSVCDVPEVHYEKYNSEYRGLSYDYSDHVAQTAFNIGDDTFLRSLISPVLIRTMENQKAPLKVICPGKVYRRANIDATHSPIFHIIEVFVVDKDITMGDLIGTLQLFSKKLLGEKTEIRLRPDNFPYTEPSVGVDLTCWKCSGCGCDVCKGEGWIELLGAGMIQPEVLEKSGIDSDVYSGFAFGIGVERTAMCHYGIDDIRLLYENDVRFLKQFK